MDPCHGVRFFYPRFLFLFISFMTFMCRRECNSYDVKCCLSWLLLFTAFLERPSHLAGRSPDPGTHSLLVTKSPVLCSFTKAQRPRSPELCASARSACRWGQNPLRQAHRTSGGEGDRGLLQPRRSLFLVIHLCLSFCLCSPLSFSFSLSADFCFSASCLPHPKSWAQPSLL